MLYDYSYSATVKLCKYKIIKYTIYLKYHYYNNYLNIYIK